mgnify:CR=1 FL=1
MRKIQGKKPNLAGRGLFCAGVSALALQAGAFAQEVVEEEATEEVTVISEDAETEELTQDRVVIVGSRIQRSEFNSISPVQILQADTSRAVGLVSAADILQTSTADSGLKIDATFNGFVLDNGPGGSTVNLRGLGAERTLVLVNNRRLAPAGVEGAPSAADLNLIPSILLDRIEVLLDGASSIYGADAVAGVANAVLRTDIEGFEFGAEYSVPTADGGGGNQTTFSGAWGLSNDSGYMGFGAEYTTRNRIRFSDREFTEECQKDLVIGENGGIDDQGCELSLRNRVFNPTGYGSIYYTPGFTNTGIPNFSESQLEVFGVPFDANGDGVSDVDLESPFYNINASAREAQADLVSPQDRYSVFAYGEYDLGWDNNTSIFFEALYSKRESTINGGPSVIFPTVPGTNPYNPCNEDTGGVNCLAPFGVNLGPLDWYTIVTIQGDRESVSADVAQTRFVGGLKGDLNALQNVGLDNWTYELSAQYSESSGQSKREGILNDRLLLSLNTSVVDPSTGNIVCGIDTDGDGLPNNEQIGVFSDEDLLTVPCVPVNLFAPTIFQEGGGTFATQAETDYVFGTRNFNTQIDQTVVQGIVQGDVFELPWNGSKVPLVLGFEYRDESIFSDPDTVAEDGLLIAFFADKGATGRRDLMEAFAETEITPIRGVVGAEELTFNLSTRWTEESNFGALWTYSAKAKYRPVDWLALNATAGTSYRAPGLREQFLAGATGFNSFTDPCVVPLVARIDQGPGNDPIYDATTDERSQQTLDNCALDGVNPLTLGLTGNIGPTQSLEISSGGAEGLRAEESDSYTVGFTVEQPWFDNFDLRLNLTYYDTEITDSVAEPGAAFIIRDCYEDNPNLGSAFCNRLQRDSGGFLSSVDASFLNIGRETATGFDLNVLFEKEFILNERPLDFSIDLRANKTEERILDLSNTLAPDASPEEIEASIDDNLGEPEFPEWRVNTSVAAGYGDWTARWFTRFISEGQDDSLNSEPGQEVDFTDDYFVHNASISYSPGTWSVTVGVENVFDEAPPLVHDDGTFSVRNVPIGVGYDVFGRTAFVQVSKEF